MTIISFQGLMGGTGNTSIVGGLAFALTHLKESVLVMDLCPTNFLGVQFNMPINHRTGWAHALVNNTPVEKAAMRYVKGIDFLPFGELKDQNELDLALKNHPNYFEALFEKLNKTNRYQWLLLDLPHQACYFNTKVQKIINSQIITLNPNSNCHVRLCKYKANSKNHYLINKYNPSHILEHDLQLLWAGTRDNVLPVNIHQDPSISEAQALKMPVNRAFPERMASKDLTALAHWLIDNDHTGINQ